MEKYVKIRASDYDKFSQDDKMLIDHPIIGIFILPFLGIFIGFAIVYFVVSYLEYEGTSMKFFFIEMINFFTSKFYLTLVIIIAGVWGFFKHRKRKKLINTCKELPEISDLEDVPVRIIKC